MTSIFMTLHTFQLLMSPLKEEAPLNMYPISVTLNTSQLLTSPLKEEVSVNMFRIVLTQVCVRKDRQ